MTTKKLRVWVGQDVWATGQKSSYKMFLDKDKKDAKIEQDGCLRVLCRSSTGFYNVVDIETGNLLGFDIPEGELVQYEITARKVSE